MHALTESGVETQPDQRRGRHVRPATHMVALWFQCVKELCALLQSQALLLPSLKLLLESPDASLHALALEHLAAVDKVSAAGRPTCVPGVSQSCCSPDDHDLLRLPRPQRPLSADAASVPSEEKTLAYLTFTEAESVFGGGGCKPDEENVRAARTAGASLWALEICVEGAPGVRRVLCA